MRTGGSHRPSVTVFIGRNFERNLSPQADHWRGSIEIKKVLVTGASGFIGSHLVKALSVLDIEAICPVRSERSAGIVAALGGRPVAGDLSRSGPWSAALGKVDTVFHVAGLVRALRIEDYHRHNVQAMAVLLEAMNNNPPLGQRLIVLSSLAAAGPSDKPPGRTEVDEPEPVSEYGRSKLAAEHLAMSESDRRFTAIVRAPAVYGPRDLAFLPLFRCLKAGIAPVFRGRDFTLSLVYVKDLVHVLIKIVCDSDKPGILHLSDGVPHTWCGLCATVAKTMNKRIHLLPIPMKMVRLVCLMNGFLDRFRTHASFLNPDKWGEINAAGWLCGSTHTPRDSGLPPPIPLDRGILETLDWYREHKWL